MSLSRRGTRLKCPGLLGSSSGEVCNTGAVGSSIFAAALSCDGDGTWVPGFCWVMAHALRSVNKKCIWFRREEMSPRRFEISSPVRKDSWRSDIPCRISISPIVVLTRSISSLNRSPSINKCMRSESVKLFVLVDNDIEVAFLSWSVDAFSGDGRSPSGFMFLDNTNVITRSNFWRKILFSCSSFDMRASCFLSTGAKDIKRHILVCSFVRICRLPTQTQPNSEAEQDVIISGQTFRWLGISRRGSIAAHTGHLSCIFAHSDFMCWLSWNLITGWSQPFVHSMSSWGQRKTGIESVSRLSDVSEVSIPAFKKDWFSNGIPLRAISLLEWINCLSRGSTHVDPSSLTPPHWNSVCTQSLSTCRSIIHLWLW